MPAASRPPLQPIEAGSVHLSEVDVLLLSRVAWLGLAAMERRDGCAPAAFRDVVDRDSGAGGDEVEELLSLLEKIEGGAA